jgi:thymidylate synthase (FAD)
MKITLLNHTPLYIASEAIRTAWQSFDKSDTNKDVPSDVYTKDMIVKHIPICGEKDRELIDRVGNKYKHSSTLEHLYYNFRIQEVSRALLQEYARHRIASPTVKSTRYTLKELKKEEPFNTLRNSSARQKQIDKARAEKYLVLTDDEDVDDMSIKALENLRQLVTMNKPNDKVKYALPEAYKTELVWSVNARSLQNFLLLRSDKSALWEMRLLARAVFEALPRYHKYLFEFLLKDK